MPVTVGEEITAPVVFMQTSDFDIVFSGINKISQKTDSEFSYLEMFKNSIEDICTKSQKVKYDL